MVRFKEYSSWYLDDRVGKISWDDDKNEIYIEFVGLHRHSDDKVREIEMVGLVGLHRHTAAPL